MSPILYVLIFVISNAFVDTYATDCNFIEDKSPSVRVYRHLFCDYDPSERPVTHPKNTTTVTVRLYPKIIKYDVSSHTMQLHTWYQLVWLDEFLKWNQKEFEGIDQLLVPLRHIWSPDIYLENVARANQMRVDISNNHCLLYPSGFIMCVPAILFSTRCDVDYTHWPFEKPSCRIEFSSWTHHHNGITFDRKAFLVITKNTYVNVEWTLVSVSISFDNKTSRYWTSEEFPTVAATFILERRGNRLWTILGTLIVLLTAMTLTTLWINPKSNERLLIACTNFFCHFLCIGYLHYIVPQSHTIPNILMFCHNSMVIAVVALILTGLFRKIEHMEGSLPPLIAFIVTKTMMSKLGRILSLSILDRKGSLRLEDADCDGNRMSSSTQRSYSWVDVTTILGWMSFISTILIYVIMFAKYLHVPSV